MLASAAGEPQLPCSWDPPGLVGCEGRADRTLSPSRGVERLLGHKAATASWITAVIHVPRRQPTRRRSPLPYNLHGVVDQARTPPGRASSASASRRPTLSGLLGFFPALSCFLTKNERMTRTTKLRGQRRASLSQDDLDRTLFDPGPTTRELSDEQPPGFQDHARYPSGRAPAHTRAAAHRGAPTAHVAFRRRDSVTT